MNNKMNLSFSATDPYVEINKVLPIEKIFRGQSYVSWGEDNKYPDYLYSLYSNVSTLKSIILSCINYVKGEEILSNNTLIISNEELDELISDIALSYFIYGGFALNVLRNKRGDVCKLVCLDFRKVRSDEKGDVFYYSKDFNKKYVRKIDTIVLPKFVKEQKNVNSSIFYYKNDKYSISEDMIPPYILSKRAIFEWTFIGKLYKWVKTFIGENLNKTEAIKDSKYYRYEKQLKKQNYVSNSEFNKIIERIDNILG